MILRISAPASAWIEGTNETSPELLASINGVDHDEVFSEYFIDDIDPIVKELKVNGGKLHFQYDSQKQLLWARIDYTAQAHLIPKQTEALVTYTLGQLSDGIGNNFVQKYVERTGVFIDLSVRADMVKLEYLS